jgi:penicillin-binding protein 1A
MIFDSSGRLITILHAGENRILVPIERIPVITRQAVIAAEDERFYQHHGVDAKAVIRAAIKNAAVGRVVQGGSTITEQLVKNTIGTDERTLARKIHEAETAWAVENGYSKDEILDMYLNTVYFGQGAYGIQAAAKTYFSIPATKLDLEQSALLAGLIRSPSGYDPVFHPGVATSRRNYVLRRMWTLGQIDRPTYLEASGSKIDLRPYKDSRRYAAPYFVDFVKRWFLSNEDFGATYEDRYNLLFGGGLRIYTTVDLRLQRYAEQAVHSILPYKTDPYGAMTVLDPNTGAIKAMVGGRDYFARKARFAKLNLATGGATGRQAGSSFKPFALVTALERGISPDDVYLAPSHINIKLPPGYRPPVWPVDNYDGGGGGAETLEQATIHSVNTVYAQVIMQVGPRAVIDTAHRMGITRKLAAVPSAVLGTNEVDTLDMASAFGTLATIGKHTPPIAVSKIIDGRGEVMYEAEPNLEEVITPSVAWTADRILQEVIQSGTGTAAKLDRPAAGKTGTAQQWSDAWFVGFTPQLVAAVWVGFPQARIRMVAPRVRISHVLGGTWPAQIWHAFMVKAMRGVRVRGFKQPTFVYVDVRVDRRRWCLPNRWTLPTDIRVVHVLNGTQPNGWCTDPSGPQFVALPSVVGLSQDSAVNLLQSYGFGVLVDTRPSGGPPGVVLSQDPAPGQRTLQGGLVRITVSFAAPTPPPSPKPSPTPTPTPTPSPSPSPSPSP